MNGGAQAGLSDGGKFGDGALHVERGAHGELGVILVGYRRAEDGHQAVAGKFIHQAVVVVDGSHHQAQKVVDELEHRFGIEGGREMREIDRVHKQHGDLAAFTPQPFGGVQQAVGHHAGQEALQTLEGLFRIAH
ncbi:MAG: hypothetical protein BWY25_02489 [Chloroflexi bacterium ADurb.Bin222]|nr:MAG: hypothetical protein BWY25_02489 [Chloroflexi bacterium ADurb.Bin222]